MNYPESCPDYYEKRFNSATYAALLQNLSNIGPNTRLCVTDRGLETTSRIKAIWEGIKGWFGLDNAVKLEKLQAEWLKFLHYGLVKGYFHDPAILQSLQTINSKANYYLQNTNLNITVRTIISPGTLDEKIDRVRIQLIEYCNKHYKQLEPSFWNSLIAKTTLLSFPTKDDFGITYISMAYAETEQYNLWKKFEYLHKATSSKFPMNEYYSQQLGDCLNQAIRNYDLPTTPLIDSARKICLRLAKREYIRNRPKTALDYLDKAIKLSEDHLEAHYSYIKFISLAEALKYSEAEKMVNDLPEMPENKLDLSSRFTDALVIIGDSKLSYAKSKRATFVSYISLGYIDQRKTYSSQALDYYKKAFDSSEEKQGKDVLKKLCQHLDDIRGTALNLEDFQKDAFELGLGCYEKSEWENAAYFFLLSMKCFSSEELSSFAPAGDIRTRFAQSIANMVKEEKINENSLNLLNQAIQHHQQFDEENIEEFINAEGKNFLNDQGACLYFLKGKVMQKLGGYPKSDILEAFDTACKLAPENPWGAWAYFAKDDQRSAKDNDEVLIAYSEKLAIEWGAAREIPL